jgi:hypothetical protein
MQDSRTPHRNYPVPVPDNFLQDDVGRIAQAITDVDADVDQHQKQLHKLKHRLRRIRLEVLLG